MLAILLGLRDGVLRDGRRVVAVPLLEQRQLRWRAME